MRIALGLDVYMDDFTRSLSAQSWKVFSGDAPEEWQTRFLELMGSEHVTVFFNLDGVDVWRGLLRAATCRGGPTDWELLQIQQNPQWWPRITWLKRGEPVPNPF